VLRDAAFRSPSYMAVPVKNKCALKTQPQGVACGARVRAEGTFILFVRKRLSHVAASAHICFRFASLQRSSPSSVTFCGGMPSCITR
jgi:hypothetical protein